ncbi:MAG: TetR/AcrR family transcriptional regulator [Clostridia bacterium]|nr:TetR/AcrR family transcriptional regulator [Clostridia bacterium]
MPSKTFFNLSEEKKEKLVIAAIEEFSERNIREAKVALIMKRANISRGSFYNYFDSIEDLYKYIILRLRNVRLNFLREHMLTHYESFLGYFKDLYMYSVKFLIINPHYIRISKHLYSSDHPASVELVNNLEDIYTEDFTRMLELDSARALIKEGISIESVVSLCVQISTVIFVYELKSMDMTVEKYEEHIDHLISIISNGIVN